MENANFIENVATRLGQAASVKNVYGDPITTNGKTIIPVARISYGFGGGFGNKDRNRSLGEGALEGQKEERGAGGGGGLRACAAGVYEITNTDTRFIPAHNLRGLFVAALAGLLIGGMMGRRH